MSEIDLDRVFEGVRRARVGVLGDFCLDRYLFIDPEWRVLSVETGLPVRGVSSERHSPGGAGNVAADAKALGAAYVHCIGCVGDDADGVCLARDLEALGCDASGLFVQEEGYATRAYVKPYCEGREESRFDFGVANRVSGETARRVIGRLEELLPGLDAVMINQQVAAGVWGEELLSAAGRLAREFPDVAWVADSRDHPERFAGMTVKLNASEAARLCGRDAPPGAAGTSGSAPRRTEGAEVPAAETEADLRRLFARLGGAVVITRGAEGAAAIDSAGAHGVPGVRLEGETDPVGAGDAFSAALGCSMGTGSDLGTAVTVAAWAAAVTVRKLRRTGTASEAEVRAIASEAGGLAGQPGTPA